MAVNAPATLGARTNDSLIVKLPLEAWARDIAARRTPPVGGSWVKPPPPSPPPAPPPPADKPARNGQVLDMAEYLTGKGHQVARLAEGRFLVDGDPATAGQMLKLVNDYRAKADLDPLPHGKAW